MTAITAFTQLAKEDIVSSDIAGTATPWRRQRIFLAFQSEGSSDTVDLNGVVGDKISDTTGLLFSSLDTQPSSGTADVDFAGTSIMTVGGVGEYEAEVEVVLK